MANIGAIMFQLGDQNQSKKYFYASIKNIAANIKGNLDQDNIFGDEGSNYMDSRR